MSHLNPYQGSVLQQVGLFLLVLLKQALNPFIVVRLAPWLPPTISCAILPRQVVSLCTGLNINPATKMMVVSSRKCSLSPAMTGTISDI